MAGTATRSGWIGLIAALIVAAVLMSAGHPRVMMAAAGGLANSDVDAIISQGVAAANTTASADGLRSSPGNKRATKMVIAVVARDGKLLKVFAQPDAWVGSQDIAIAKARTAAFFSSDENALTSRIIGVLS